MPAPAPAPAPVAAQPAQAPATDPNQRQNPAVPLQTPGLQPAPVAANQLTGAPPVQVPTIDPATGQITMKLQDAIDSAPGQLIPNQLPADPLAGGLQAGIGGLQAGGVAPVDADPALVPRPLPVGPGLQPLADGRGGAVRESLGGQFKQPVPDPGGGDAIAAKRLQALRQFGG
jgi:hypothetical protein